MPYQQERNVDGGVVGVNCVSVGNRFEFLLLFLDSLGLCVYASRLIDIFCSIIGTPTPSAKNKVHFHGTARYPGKSCNSQNKNCQVFVCDQLKKFI